MQLQRGALEDHVASVAELLERYGVVLDLGPDDALELDETPSGTLTFELRGFLPDGRQPHHAVLEVREVWRAAGDAFERSEYEYELLDHQRGYRRAFHLHDRDAFARRFDVVVHEHCEQPVGVARCEHHAGLPVRDPFAAVELLVGVWVDPLVPDCGALQCLGE